MVAGAGVFGSIGVVAVDARLPCNLRLKPFASFITCAVASVVSNAFTNRVDNAFKPLKALTLSFTLLLYAVFLVITSAKLVCDAVANALKTWQTYKI
jgi:urea transporter